ncbi:MAG: zinc ribbon-containing protein [Vibrio ordalii]|uniref:zinc ribbon-containing protein n=1 Tax=Vibrio ordalii TaxID=28174 RepID=UPI003F389D09
MPKRKTSYEEIVDDVIETLKHSPDEMSQVLQTSGKFVDAANDLTKDELALISAYVTADLKEFADSFEESKSSPFSLMITNSIWQGLFEITDKTKVEWVELFQDLERQGLYQAGEMIGLGMLVCDHCGHKTQYNHPTEVMPCIQCGQTAFARQPLKP